jgi:hypothetical protein
MPKNPPKFEKPGKVIPPTHIEEYIGDGVHSPEQSPDNGNNDRDKNERHESGIKNGRL